MRAFAAIVPSVSVAFLVVLAALPWGASDSARIALPLVPVLAIHFWSARRPTYLPAVAVFGLGLLLDISAQGPLGFYALISLAVALLSRYLSDVPAFAPHFSRWFLALIITVFSVAAVWALTSFYLFSLLPIPAHITAFAVLVACYPLMAVCLNALEALAWPDAARSILGRPT